MNPTNQLGIDITKTTGIVCENCGNNIFTPAVFLRQASRFITGTPRDVIAPMQVFACIKCQHVNDEFNPLLNLTEDNG
jgi:hypothetical protein